uniref:Large ribosomal subunit protein bL12 C-terminal domain-containing protein n=1 Tax=Cyanothece sp. (strain PCC 7425 / ATCC 29141) TaxID=395961 RepID=B8HS36_CYAP4
MVTWLVVAALIFLAFIVGFSLGLLRSRGMQQETVAPKSSPTVEELIRSGRKIDAIKYYRQLYGVGLKEAKEAVDSLERQQRRGG